MKTYNEKMNSCRSLEKIMLSHSEPSSALRDELGSLQYRIAQEGAALWLDRIVRMGQLEHPQILVEEAN